MSRCCNCVFREPTGCHWGLLPSMTHEACGMYKDSFGTEYRVERTEIDEVTRVYYVDADSPEEAVAAVEGGKVECWREENAMIGTEIRDTTVEEA